MRKFYPVLFAVLFATIFAGFSNAQSKMAVGVQGGIALPMGDFGDAVDLGFGGQGNFAYTVSPNLQVTGSIGYLTWSYKTDGNIASGSFSSVPVLAGIRYTFPAKGFAPYVMAQLGLHFISSSFEIEYDPFIFDFLDKTSGTESTDATLVTQEFSDSSSKFGFGFGAGFLLPLSPKLDLDVNATFNSIATEGSATNYIGIMAGVLVAL